MCLDCIEKFEEYVKLNNTTGIVRSTLQNEPEECNKEICKNNIQSIETATIESKPTMRFHVEILDLKTPTTYTNGKLSTPKNCITSEKLEDCRPMKSLLINGNT